MEFIGIDIGEYKTVLASSRENGRVYEDEQGKRSMRTVLETSVPARRFGNAVMSDVEQALDVRRKSFRDGIKTAEGAESMLMFLGYLERIVKKNTQRETCVCFCVPVGFKEIERRRVLDAANAAGMKVGGMVSDMSAIGMFACLRRENVNGEFVVFDFGFSKSSAGLFSFEKNVFKPLYLKSVGIGAVQFDEKLIDVITKKYGLERTRTTIERIRRQLDRVKTALNSTGSCTVQVFVGESVMDMSVTQEEYRTAAGEVLKELRGFVEEVMNDVGKRGFEGAVEVVGGNSNSFLIREMLKDVKHQATLNVSDSCAIGAAFGVTCANATTKYVLYDIVGREMSVKIEGEEVKPTVVFAETDIVGGNAKVVTYNRKGPFVLEIIEEGNVVSRLEVKKTESEEPEAIHVSLVVSKFGTVDVKSIECKGNAIDYEYHTHGIGIVEMNEITAVETRHREVELGLEKIGIMRNELEKMAMELGDTIKRRFGDLFSGEEIDRVRAIADELFDVRSSSSVAEEEEVRRKMLGKLSFVNEKITEKMNSIVEQLNKYRDAIECFRKENKKVFTAGMYRLQGAVSRIDEYIRGIEKLDLFNVEAFDGEFPGKIWNEIQKCMKDVSEELKREEEKEKERMKTEKKEEKTENEKGSCAEEEDNSDPAMEEDNE